MCASSAEESLGLAPALTAEEAAEEEAAAEAVAAPGVYGTSALGLDLSTGTNGAAELSTRSWNLSCGFIIARDESRDTSRGRFVPRRDALFGLYGCSHTHQHHISTNRVRSRRGR
jgi:hypothetical protein